MKNKLISAAGWYGVIIILGAYMLVSFSVMSPTSLFYQILNLTGAIGITVETYSKRDYQPFWLNLAWSLIALVAIVNILIHLK
jgi:hypothetical protein